MLERLAREQQAAGDGPYRFYLPNCSKSGLYHSKQVRAPRGPPRGPPALLSPGEVCPGARRPAPSSHPAAPVRHLAAGVGGASPGPAPSELLPSHPGRVPACTPLYSVLPTKGRELDNSAW